MMMLCSVWTFSFIEIELDRSLADRTAPATDIGSNNGSPAAVPPVPVINSASPQAIEASPSNDIAATKPAQFSVSSLAKSIVEPWLTTIVALWGIGVLFASARPLLSWYFVRRLRTVGVSAVSKDTLELLERTAASLGLSRSIEIVNSKLVEIPAVIGYLRPLILLPLSAVNGLTVQQLEALLAHELAHIRRHDYLVNLLQNVVETLLFYHPAVWWVSRHIRLERENCCDDIAVSVCKDRATYAEALLTVENLRGNAGFALSSDGGSLLSRVRRLATPAERGQASASWWLASMVSIASLVIFAVSIWISTDDLIAVRIQ
jgi:beta-lactamase regulating signal transducer with metallopeptidase domain